VPDEPKTDTTDDADDEEIAMDGVEAEAGFLDDRDPEDYPSVLRITRQSSRRGLDWEGSS
jgi:hypothetical protein